jgi:hypothetical protein
MDAIGTCLILLSVVMIGFGGTSGTFLEENLN